MQFIIVEKKRRYFFLYFIELENKSTIHFILLQYKYY